MKDNTTDNRTTVRRYPMPGLPQANKFEAYDFDFESIGSFDLSGYLDELLRFEAEVISNARQFQTDILSSLPKAPDTQPQTGSVNIPEPNINSTNTEGE